MVLTATQKKICEQVVNVFETGTIAGDYGAIATYADGPHDVRQVTYGRSQTTEYSNLDELLEMYVKAGGSFSAKLKPYLSKIGVVPLADDKVFKQLLRDAGRTDAVMQKIQDEFFEKRYFQKAVKWADANGFTLPLSMLVIYDSQIHSGGILDFLRKRFVEAPPAKGGDEKKWIKQYVEARQAWLAATPKLKGTVYRTKCFQAEIARQNWNLAKLPIDTNGTKVSGA
jgi:chitosanase